MKTYRHLYSKLCSFENLFVAYRRARKGKRGKPCLRISSSAVKGKVSTGDKTGGDARRYGMALAEESTEQHSGSAARQMGVPYNDLIKLFAKIFR